MYDPSSSNASSSRKKNKKLKLKNPKTPYEAIENLYVTLNNYVGMVNQSKLFAGLMIILLNISSKFVTIKLSKSMESYLKYTFSRNILIFTIAWMGTREIYIALIITVLFIICMDYLFNEESVFCCLPEKFTNYHIELFEQNITEEDYKKALEVVEKYESRER
jgi:hypothetical protein